MTRLWLELALKEGQHVHVMRQDSDDWWFAKCVETGETGWFPASYVSIEGDTGVEVLKGMSSSTSSSNFGIQVIIIMITMVTITMIIDIDIIL